MNAPDAPSGTKLFLFCAMTKTSSELAEEAEKSLEILKTNFDDLSEEVTETENDADLPKSDIEQRAVLFSERVTQDLLALDGISISKGEGAEASRLVTAKQQ